MRAKISITEQNAEIEASQEEVSAFLEKVIPNFVLESGGILSDAVRFWKWKNQINIFSQNTTGRIILVKTFFINLILRKISFPL